MLTKCDTVKIACYDYYKLAPITMNLAHGVANTSLRREGRPTQPFGVGSKKNKR